MPKGGKRTGAGRPKGTGIYGVPTVPIRIPVHALEWWNECGKMLFLNEPDFNPKESEADGMATD